MKKLMKKIDKINEIANIIQTEIPIKLIINGIKIEIKKIVIHPTNPQIDIAFILIDIG